MAQSALEKIGLLIGGGIHAVLNSAIDAMPLATAEQQIRVIEGHLQDIDNGVNEAIANSRLAEKRLGGIQEEIAYNTDVVLKITNDGDPSNDHLAEEPAQRIIVLEDERKAEQANMTSAAEVRAKMEKALALLTARKEQLVGRVSYLRSTEKQAKASEAAVTALRKVSQALDSTADGGSFDSSIQRATRNREIANAGLERELAKVERKTVKPTMNAEVAAKIAAIKASAAPKVEKPADAA